MSAVLDTPTADPQPQLDGMPAAPTPSLQAPALDLASAGMCLFIGRLVTAAAVVVDSHNRVTLQALIDQHLPTHPHALPVLAVHLWPNAGDYSFADLHSRATARAAQLPAGAAVVARAAGAEVCTHHRQQVLRLIACEGLDLVDRIPALNPTTSANPEGAH